MPRSASIVFADVHVAKHILDVMDGFGNALFLDIAVECVVHHSAHGMIHLSAKFRRVRLCVQEINFESIQRLDAQHYPYFSCMFGSSTHAVDAPIPFVLGAARTAEVAEGGMIGPNNGLHPSSSAAVECFLVAIDTFFANGGIGTDRIIVRRSNRDAGSFQSQIVESLAPSCVVQVEIEYRDLDSVVTHGFELFESRQQAFVKFAGPKQKIHAVLHNVSVDSRR